jgi:glucosamine--fructose-6-phosphate aminotransferase (isomerizing)
MAALAGRFAGTDRLFVLRYGIGHGVALEAALKCKEVTGLPCEGMFSSEVKHGPLAMVEEGTPVFLAAPPSGTEMLTNAVTEAVPFQLLAYSLSTARGLDADFPRNLSKTLTVDRGRGVKAFPPIREARTAAGVVSSQCPAPFGPYGPGDRERA